MNYMNAYENEAQAVWAAPTMEQKKDLLIEMVHKFKAKGQGNVNVHRWIASINKERRITRLDEMAAQLVLCVDNKVIKV